MDEHQDEHQDEPSEEARLLHQLRVQGMVADGPGRGATAGMAAEALLAAGFAISRREALVLTPAGRAEADRRFCLVGGPAEEHVRSAYERFGPLNQLLLAICTDWQVRAGGVPNDHRDSVYDWGVIDRLVALDDQSGPIVRSLGRRVPRFAPYRERMRAARKRVEDGEPDWLLSPRIDSYHTVWMQLHEDLLLGVGIQRGDEPVDEPGDG